MEELEQAVILISLYFQAGGVSDLETFWKNTHNSSG